MIMVQNVFHANESYTHDNWVYKDISVGFSRIYYVIDGDAYYEENGKKIRLKKGYLYLTPANVSCTLYDNPENKLLHTYSHINTVPQISEFLEIKVDAGTVLSDAVELWRKHIHTVNWEKLIPIVQLILSSLEKSELNGNAIAARAKLYIDRQEDFSFNMSDFSRELGYSREHLTRSFFSAYGLTPKEYFNQRRMNKALELLANKSMLYEIAAALEYSSAYSFSKAFKKHFGLSPERYRQSFCR